jgi:YggT family protein
MLIFDPFFEILGLIVDIYFKIVVVQVVLFWLIHFKVLEPSNKYAIKTVELLDKATTPVYNRLKAKIPTVFSGLDFAPFIVLLALYFVSRLIVSLRLLIAG